jgi:phosphopantetheinyl transferase
VNAPVRAWVLRPSARVDLGCLTVAERETAAALTTHLQRARHLRSRAALRHAVAALRTTDPADVPLLAPPGARPRLAGGDMSLSLSHTAGLVAVAVGGHGPVGIDVERPRARRRPVPALVATPRRLAALPATVPPRLRPLVAWVVLEAALKAVGTGFATAHAAAVFHEAGDGLEVDLGDVGRVGVALRLRPDVVAAVATPAAVPVVRWRHAFTPHDGARQRPLLDRDGAPDVGLVTAAGARSPQSWTEPGAGHPLRAQAHHHHGDGGGDEADGDQHPG